MLNDKVIYIKTVSSLKTLLFNGRSFQNTAKSLYLNSKYAFVVSFLFAVPVQISGEKHNVEFFSTFFF